MKKGVSWIRWARVPRSGRNYRFDLIDCSVLASAASVDQQLHWVMVTEVTETFDHSDVFETVGRLWDITDNPETRQLSPVQKHDAFKHHNMHFIYLEKLLWNETFKQETSLRNPAVPQRLRTHREVVGLSSVTTLQDGAPRTGGCNSQSESFCFALCWSLQAVIWAAFKIEALKENC